MVGAEVTELTVALALVVAFATTVALSKVDVSWSAPVRIVTDGEDVVCAEKGGFEAFAAATLVERRVTEPSWGPGVEVVADTRIVEE